MTPEGASDAGRSPRRHRRAIEQLYVAALWELERVPASSVAWLDGAS